MTLYTVVTFDAAAEEVTKIVVNSKNLRGTGGTVVLAPEGRRGAKTVAFKQQGELRPSRHRVRQASAVAQFVKRHGLVPVAAGTKSQPSPRTVGSPKGKGSRQVKDTNAVNETRIYAREKFKTGVPLTEKEEKFCGCVIDVASKQSKDCLKDKAWRQVRNGKRCYSPYAICGKSVGTSSRGCFRAYDFDNMADTQLRSFAYLKDIPVPRPYNRGALLRRIHKNEDSY